MGRVARCAVQERPESFGMPGVCRRPHRRAPCRTTFSECVAALQHNCSGRRVAEGRERVRGEEWKRVVVLRSMVKRAGGVAAGSRWVAGTRVGLHCLHSCPLLSSPGELYHQASQPLRTRAIGRTCPLCCHNAAVHALPKHPMLLSLVVPPAPRCVPPVPPRPASPAARPPGGPARTWTTCCTARSTRGTGPAARRVASIRPIQLSTNEHQ